MQRGGGGSVDEPKAGRMVELNVTRALVSNITQKQEHLKKH